MNREALIEALAKFESPEPFAIIERIEREPTPLHPAEKARLQRIKEEAWDDRVDARHRARLFFETALLPTLQSVGEALEPFGIAGETALISGRPPGEHVDANAFLTASTAHKLIKGLTDG